MAILFAILKIQDKAATALLVTLLGGEACAGSTRRVLLVEHHAAVCVGVGLQLCLLVRQPTESHFSYHHGGIEGFDYQWGFRYQIEVEEHQVSELAADASSIRTVLRRVATKEPVDPATQFFLVLTRERTAFWRSRRTTIASTKPPSLSARPESPARDCGTRSAGEPGSDTGSNTRRRRETRYGWSSGTSATRTWPGARCARRDGVVRLEPV